MSVPCPTCGKALNTEQGMRQHHTKVHGEPLPNRECSGCGTEFYDPKARLEYCDDCNPNAGEHNGNWKGAKESAECALCEVEFEYYPSDKDGVYCPECVAETSEFLGTHYTDVHGIELLERECKHCADTFEIPPSDLQYGGGKFCCRECYDDWWAEHRDLPQSAYTGSWSPVRRRALQRDNHTCQHCGKSKRDIGQEPDVHHIKPIREFEDPQNAHTIENLVSLCRACHAKVEVGDIPVPDVSCGAVSRKP